jgi:hypothetical protein
LPSGYRVVRLFDKSISIVAPTGASAIEGRPDWIIHKIASGESCFAVWRGRVGQNNVDNWVLFDAKTGLSMEFTSEPELQQEWDRHERRPILWQEPWQFY